MKFIYNLLLIIFLPFFVLSTKRKGYSANLKERLVLTKKAGKNYLWFHCASVGELNVAYPVIKYYEKKFPILITVSSPRGREFAEKKYPEAVIQAVPFDFGFLIKRFIKKYKPISLIIVEGEFWYNLVTETSKKIPVISINTRISPDSYKLYKKFKFFYEKILNRFKLFIVRSKTDYNFLKEFANEEKLILCGDLKFVSSKSQINIDFQKEGRIIIAGSTHPPEEEIILKVFKKLKKKFPDLKLIIAPRHLERINEVKNLLKKEGLEFTLRTENKRAEKDVYLIDTIGELAGFYKYADVVFIGGTIANIGGHNVLEAILENKPVIIGKNYYKIAQIVEELKESGLLFIVDEDKLFDTFEKILKEKTGKINFENLRNEIFNCYIKNIDKVLGTK